MRHKSSSDSIFDVMDAGFLDTALDELNSTYEGWQKTDQHGNRSLWSMLGKVYELGPSIDENKAARARLVAKVNTHPTVQGKNSWKADHKKTYDLLLILLLGLKDETKATKSQWLGAIRAAGIAKIEPESDKFVSWMEVIGGVNAARKSVTRKPSPERNDIKTWLPKLAEFIDQQQEMITLPELWGERTFPGGMGVLLVQKGSHWNEGRPIATLTNHKLIISAIKVLLAQAGRKEREMISSMNADLRKRQKAAMPNWRKYSETGDYAGSLDDYLNEGCPEF